MWKNCNPSCVTIVKNVWFYPYPPKSRDPLTVRAQLQVGEKIEEGHISLKVYREGQPIYDKYDDICDYCNDIGLPCPIQAGIHNITIPFPVILPKGEYYGRVTAWSKKSPLQETTSPHVCGVRTDRGRLVHVNICYTVRDLFIYYLLYYLIVDLNNIPCYHISYVLQC